MGYKLTLTRNTDNSVLNKDNAINNAKNKINTIEWYVPHYTPSITQQAIISEQILSKVATELQNVERCFYESKYSKFMKFWSRHSGRN